VVDATKALSQIVVTRENGKHTRHFGGGAGVDAAHRRVGMWRAQKHGPSLAWQDKVVGVLTASGDQSQVLLTWHRLSDKAHDIASAL
jgi:hypothetical protein